MSDHFNGHKTLVFLKKMSVFIFSPKSPLPLNILKWDEIGWPKTNTNANTDLAPV